MCLAIDGDMLDGRDDENCDAGCRSVSRASVSGLDGEAGIGVAVLGAVMEAAADAVVGVDAGGRIVLVNAAAERLFGWDRRELVGQRLAVLIPERLRVAHERALAGFTSDPRARSMGAGGRVPARRRDGSEFLAQISLAGVDTDAGRVSIATVQDISVRARLEDDQSRVVAELDEAQRLAGLGSWSWNPQSGVVTWSEGMYRLFGCDSGDGPVTHEAFVALVHPDDRAGLLACYERAFEGGEPWAMDYRIIRGDGEQRTLHAAGGQSGGQPGHFVGTVLDVTELRAQEHELRRSQREVRAQSELLSAVIDHAAIGMACVGLDGRWARVNQALCEIVGYRESELRGLRFHDLTHPEDRDAHREDVQRLLAGETRTFQMQKRYLHKDGHLVWVRVSVSLLRDDHGHPEQFISQIEDITAAKQTEQQLRDSQARLQAIFEHVPAAIALRDLDGRYEHANTYAAAALRLTPEQMIGRHTAQLLPSDIARQVADQDEQLLRSGVPASEELTIPSADGTARDYHVVRYPVRDSDGAITGLGTFSVEITERKRAERDLQRERDHSQAIIAAMSEGYALTVDGTITAINDALCRLTGFSRQELIGAVMPFPFWPADEINEAMATRDRIVAAQGGTFEITLKRRDGSRFDAEITAQPAHHADGSLLGFVNTLRDITDRKRYEAELTRRATHDPLTGLPNHRAFHERLAAELDRAAADGTPVSVAVLDLDHFKHVNDRYGHQAGDEVLHTVAQRLAGLVGEGELLARVGGEEFAWIWPAVSGLTAYAAVERARHAISATPIAPVGELTVSAGVSDLADGGELRELYQHADQALYWAKQHGRNQTFRYSPDTAQRLNAGTERIAQERAGYLAYLSELAHSTEVKHPEFADHAQRVAALASTLASLDGWSAADIQALHQAALLHDIGKVAVPDSILAKAGPLTDTERTQLQTHAAIGAEMLSAALTTEQVAWIRHHHERWDGTGYPDRLARNAIPPGAQLLAIADAYDAITHQRPYRDAMAPELAILEIHAHASNQFSAQTVALLHRALASQREPRAS